MINKLISFYVYKLKYPLYLIKNKMEYNFTFGNRAHKIDICYFKDVESAPEVLEQSKAENEILIIPSSVVKISSILIRF